MFNNTNQNNSTFPTIFKYFRKLVSMHIYCLIFPIVFLVLTINIAFYVFNYELWEIKNLVINSMILIAFAIPFAFLPFSLFSITRKPTISLIKFNREKYFRLVITIVTIFFIYYFFIFAYMLLLTVLFSISIGDNESSLINFIFKPSSKFNGTYFNNAINWYALFFSFIISFFFLFFIGYLITITFHKKTSLIVILVIFLLSMFFGGMLFPISVLNFNAGNYQPLSFISLFLYPIIMIHVSWIGFDIFSFSNILGLATEYIITTRILIISSSIVYGSVFLSFCFYILEFIFLGKNIIPFKSKQKNNHWLKIYQDISEQRNKNLAFWVANKKNRNRTIKIVKKNTKNNRKTLCFIDRTDSFIPELTFIENLEFFQKIYYLKHDFSQLNEIIELLNFQFIINKKIQKCKQHELFYLNIIFALMQKPQLICMIHPSVFFSRSIVNKVLNLINKYANDHDIEIIVISDNIKELQIFTKDIYAVTDRGISSMSQEELK